LYCCVSVVVVVEVTGAIGGVVDDCSVVVLVLVTLSALQPVSNAVPETSAMQIRTPSLDFMSIM
jgi:hypothetical protein